MAQYELTVEQVRLLSRATTWAVGQGYGQNRPFVFNDALDALHTPAKAEPCGECEDLRRRLAKICATSLSHQAGAIVSSLENRLAEAKAECEPLRWDRAEATTQRNAIAGHCSDLKKQLAEAKAINVEMQKAHYGRRSTLAFVRARKRDLIKSLDRQKQWRKKLEQQLAEAKAEVASLKAATQVLPEQEVDPTVRLTEEDCKDITNALVAWVRVSAPDSPARFRRAGKIDTRLRNMVAMGDIDPPVADEA